MPNWAYAFILGVCVIILMLMLQPSSGIIEAVGEDFDYDGFSDVRESGSPLCDGINQDPWDAGGTDTTVDDGCPGIGTVGTFSEAEFNIGTSSTRRCGDYAGGVSTAWPSDLAPTPADKITLTDISSFTAFGHLNTKPNDAGYDKRWDLKPGPELASGNWITLIDMALVSNHYPPMAPFYGGTPGQIKSFGGPPCIRHDFQPATPAQGSFFYSWFPNTWGKSSIGRPCTDQVEPSNCYTVYQPSLGFYDSNDGAVLDAQLALMKKAHLDFAVGSWFGQSDNEDLVLQGIMADASVPDSPHLSMRWAVYYEDEGTLNPTRTQIADDLAYLEMNFFGRENYLRKDGLPVVFVYGGAESCEMTQRWADGEADAGISVYVVLKVFTGYASCSPQPDSWHQYGPDTARHDFPPYSTTISPGYAQIDNTPYLARDATRFEGDANSMVADGNTWQLVTSWNEWGEGHSIEPATAFGEDYIGALCRQIPASPWMPACPAEPAFETLIGAGDISRCTNDNDTKTGDIIRAQSSQFVPFNLGDNAYEYGTIDEFNNCYGPAWGSFKAATLPSIGNHEWRTDPGGVNSAGYREYFGYNPDVTSPLYYSYDVGSWHVVVLDTTKCSGLGGGGSGCPTSGTSYQALQYAWAVADLQAQPAGKCILVYGHHPIISAGSHANSGGDRLHLNMWQALYDNGADLFVAGHDHNYQRFPRLDRNGNAADSTGIRELVVGTGGANFTNQNNGDANSAGLREGWMDALGSNFGNQSTKNSSYGVVKLTLRSGGYDWQFMPIVGKSYVDAGREVCR